MQKGKLLPGQQKLSAPLGPSAQLANSQYISNEQDNCKKN
jgi:hypothetical protein